MTNLTSYEKQLLVEFANCEMNTTNGAPERAENASELATYLWLEDRHVEDEDGKALTVNQLKGVLTGLKQKGLVSSYTDEDGEYLDFTDLGFQTVKELI